ncbi:hypothetical protein SAPIO_CDS6363 [Scedosporium apiospermum]|uniref:Amine oxidase n=1 Tax=Pseudallescheria apiosperma TaxID=563466 RepID=A0A084G458_PSEDA|nr:uncharacterized protein SAPIO_CDS6363 [Scedosporium apiospermum]KEZ42120.1 hypothetical protein SAPIO_CDS6363 [Scedosporium apiospermum]
MLPGEDTFGQGTEAYPGVNAHIHQYLFCLRPDPNIDGVENTVFQVDARPAADAVGTPGNCYGNGFYADKTMLATAGTSISDSDALKSRTWDVANTNKRNSYSHKSVSYKLVSRGAPPLLPKANRLAWKRADFARPTIHVTKYHDDRTHPADRHVPQSSGVPSEGLPAWIAADPDPQKTTSPYAGGAHVAAPAT